MTRCSVCGNELDDGQHYRCSTFSEKTAKATPLIPQHPLRGDHEEDRADLEDGAIQRPAVRVRKQ